jgi:ribonuclease P protein subunit POP4
MKITPSIINDEFVGTVGRVTASRHSGYAEISGRIIDESKNTFTIMHAGKAKSVVKEAAVFSFRFSDGAIVEIDGKLLVGKPEDRLKKHMKRLW